MRVCGSGVRCVWLVAGSGLRALSADDRTTGFSAPRPITSGPNPRPRAGHDMQLRQGSRCLPPATTTAPSIIGATHLATLCPFHHHYNPRPAAPAPVASSFVPVPDKIQRSQLAHSRAGSQVVFGNHPSPRPAHRCTTTATMPFVRAKDNEPITRSRTLFFLSVRDTSTFGSRRNAPGPSYGADVADDDERGGLLREHRVDFSQGLPPKW